MSLAADIASMRQTRSSYNSIYTTIFIKRSLNHRNILGRRCSVKSHSMGRAARRFDLGSGVDSRIHIDIAKDKYYALDEAERDGIIDRLTAEKRKGKVSVTRFKGLGEMNPLQLRESTIAPDTRRLVQLTIEPGDKTFEIMNMMLSKQRAADRKEWLQETGDLAAV